MRIALSEVPPSSKKLSRIPTLPIPNKSDQTWHNCLCRSVLGARYISLSSGRSGRFLGRALRLTFPLGRSGISSRKMKRDGTMYSGSSVAKNCLKTAMVGRCPRTGTTYPRSWRSSRFSSLARTTASRMPGHLSKTASISPSSIRKPRSLIWKSRRPRYSMLPSGR